MVEMCQVAANRDQLTTVLLPLAEQVLNVILVHLQDRCAFLFLIFHLIPPHIHPLYTLGDRFWRLL